MENFKIVFRREIFKKENSFINGSESYSLSALITKSNGDNEDIYQVKLNDIGLDSLYREFSIYRKNGFWQFTDQDNVEFNALKWDIIGRLEELLK